MSENDNIVKIKVKKSENFRQIYTIGAVGGHSPYDFRIGFYNDANDVPENGSNIMSVERKIETEVILSPVAALELNRWLSQQISGYEATFGSIVKTNNEKSKQVGGSTNIQGYI
jgi:Protein of unknown function (DUF3467)